MRRFARIVAATVLASIGLVGTAHADPPGPTDYRSSVIGVLPPTAGISARIIGGDSFFQLTVIGVSETVTVVGYRGEPYLRFLPGGEVDENERSPTKFLNRSRYETSAPPASADPTATPVWRQVTADGRWAWHDHRTHWMSPQRPPGRQPGDQILEAVIPLLLGDESLSVTVTSTWQPAPSHAPAIAAALLGVSVGIALSLLLARSSVRSRSSGTERERWLLTIVFAVASVAALLVGLWQTWSVPWQTGPPITAFALPATALLVVALGAPVRRSPFRTTFAVTSLTIVVTGQLVVWAAVRREVLVRAILPTSAPFWLDRSITAFVGALALVTGVAAVTRLARMLVGRPAGVPVPGAAS